MTRFMIWSMPKQGMLLKSEDGHFIFTGGEWSPTEIIAEYMYGHNDFVENISEAKARELFQEAFAQF